MRKERKHKNYFEIECLASQSLLIAMEEIKSYEENDYCLNDNTKTLNYLFKIMDSKYGECGCFSINLLCQSIYEEIAWRVFEKDWNI